MTKNADIDKYGYSGYGTGFDRRSVFPFPGIGFGQNVITFGEDIIINNVGMIINADANVKNWLIKVYAIKDMLGILVIVSVNVINRAMLVSVWIMKIVSAGKGW